MAELVRINKLTSPELINAGQRLFLPVQDEELSGPAAMVSGKVVTYYFYDRRPEGLPDIPLGTDYDAALRQWDEIHNRQPRIAGTLMEAFEAWEADDVDGLLSYSNKDTQRSYRRHLARLKPVFGESTWADVDLTDLRAYLKRRTAKTQGNREMAVFSVIWNWARLEGYTRLPWPAAGMERSA